MRRALAGVLLSCVVMTNPLPSQAADPACGGVPAESGDGWNVAPAAAEGVDAQALCKDIDGILAAPDPHLRSAVVVRNGKLVFERYIAPTAEEAAKNHVPATLDADTLQEMYSVTKTVSALTLGVALDRGALSGVDAPALDAFPEYADLRTPERSRITLRHILTMTSGVQWNEGGNPDTTDQALGSPDPYRFLFSQPVADGLPGEHFNYNSVAASVVSRTVKRATGRTMDDFAKTELLGPLGVTRFEWERLPHGDGDPSAGWGLQLRARDMAKIGQMMLDEGLWQGRRVVSAAWIREMVTPRIKVASGNFAGLQYGYMTWLTTVEKNGKPLDVSFALGFGGQRIFIVPALALVFVTTADYMTDGRQGSVPFGLLKTIVATTPGQ